MSGKWPISKQLFKTLDKLKEMGVAIKLRNLPGIPQCEEFDLFNPLINLDTSIGDVEKPVKDS